MQHLASGLAPPLASILAGFAFLVVSPAFICAQTPDDFNPGANGFVDSLAVQADGKILVGGVFTILGGQSRTNLGRLNNTSPATQSLTCDTSAITWLRGGTAPEVWRTTFDYCTNGVDWIALGDGIRIAGGWQLTGVSVPARATVRGRGFVTGGSHNSSSWFVEALTVTPPKLTALGLGTKGFRFTFESVAGASYVTECCDSLDPGAWTNLEQRAGTGGLETVEDSSPLVGTRFYRVRAVTPPQPTLRHLPCGHSLPSGGTWE